ncbi:MAG: phosphoenolpyruvate--protein phosphotransferase [Balneolaceae bacterium]|nr:phosphoenolpyruvate--protein phosphotransferase [Balneolaceae bacterium]MBO6546057.1 phosphoenolpyruvate--protein phosphotransferase [Balneolaceae bacterium]MBO6647453.1 phosphoenolpyruvate--protein phosphotransferase [Balneolaceae bacterium]
MSSRKSGEISIKGLPGSEGIAIGTILVLDKKKRKVQPKKIKSDAILAHLKRYAKSKEKFLIELDELAINLDQKTVGILETQKHIASDIEIEKRVNSCIEIELYSVDYSIYKVFNEFIERLKESGSELFQQRIIDIENIRDRLIDLSCEDEQKLEIEKGAILIVKDISPTDLVAFYEKGVKGLVMDKGGVTSHAAIIAHSLDIPCLVSSKIAVDSASEAKKAILDANKGELFLNPTKQRLDEYKKEIRRLKRVKKARVGLQQPSQTKDGVDFHLRANIEFVQELQAAKDYGAEGVGLLRTEALLYGGIAQKSEVEQIKFYENVLSQTDGPVVIRLFDVGGDKLNTHTPDEANPFLGWRGIRMLLDEDEMFEGQLRSILKSAGKYPGQVRILVPMISLLEEVHQVKKRITKIQKGLKKEGLAIDESIPLGIMIEVPSAALLADHFAKEVDFFSIGTNDLTQYALAVDRGNEQICTLYQQHHPSVWKLIELANKAAKENEIEISICGELAGDEIGAACLIGMGITDLSMSPSNIPKVKEALVNRSLEELQAFSKAVFTCSTSNEIKAVFKKMGLANNSPD